MKVAVLSGKGGAGKTFVAVNLAATLANAVYVDCDVEEPNGRIFFQPADCTQTEATVLLPQFDRTRCSGCRICVDFCHFNALVFIKNKPLVFPEMCHACGGCALLCPDQAVTEIKRSVGIVEQGQCRDITVVTGILHTGEASAVPVIKAALQTVRQEGRPVVIDCPPGSGCSVLESVAAADCCILVAEPTAFGFHNFQMVYELVRLLHKPCVVVINKEVGPYPPLEAFCSQENIPVLLHLPYSSYLAQVSAAGHIGCYEDKDLFRQFQELAVSVQKVVGI